MDRNSNSIIRFVVLATLFIIVCNSCLEIYRNGFELKQLVIILLANGILVPVIMILCLKLGKKR